MEVYLDNSATTRVFPEVADFMKQVMCEHYGNSSSLHYKGVESEQYLKKAKETLAGLLKVNEKDIYFTSGGTESDNLATIGAAMANYRAGKHLITTQVEHPAVSQPMKYLESQGFAVTYLPVDATGTIRMEDLQRALRPDTILVSVMHTNNEIGSIQPVEEVGNFLKMRNSKALFHVDAVQGFGKARIYPKKCGIDLLSVSAHKIHGPKGVGFLYVGEQVKLRPLLLGGGQQKDLRPGTENVPGVAGMAKAAEMCYANLEKDVLKMRELKDRLVKGLEGLENVVLHSSTGEDSAPHIVSASIRGIRSEVLLHALEDKGIFVSAGSACAANKPNSSPTLKALGLSKELAESTIRFSLSVYTTQEEIDYTLQAMYDMIPMLRRYTRR